MTTIRFQGLHRATEYLDGLDRRPVNATIMPGDLRAQLGGSVSHEGAAPAKVVDALVAATGRWPTNSTVGSTCAVRMSSSASSSLIARTGHSAMAYRGD
ncbi:MAG: PLP-dependent enzyme glutamate decarboxylase [Schlesneria sp.]|nr:PLP-dependent enzyme glutamate decarboxylase [Schlesneria sp.]